MVLTIMAPLGSSEYFFSKADLSVRHLSWTPSGEE